MTTHCDVQLVVINCELADTGDLNMPKGVVLDAWIAMVPTIQQRFLKN
jgi:hypothetical protein